MSIRTSWAARSICIALASLLLFWSAVPSFAEDPSSPCLESLRKKAAPGTEMTLTRTDGETFKGRLQGLDAGDGRLELTIFDSGASRFSTMEFDEREIQGLTYRHDTTDSGLLLMYVGGITVFSGFIGYKVGDEWGSDSANDHNAADVAAAVLGFVGSVFGLVLGLILAPKSFEEVRLDCR